MKNIKINLAFLFILLLYFIQSGISQNIPEDSTINNSKKKTQFAVYAEILGNGGLYSGNIDFSYFGNKLASMSIRAGIGSTDENELSFPTELSLLIGKNKHFCESGIGMTFLYFGSFINVLRIGYRFQNREKGIIIRAGITPYLDIDDFWNKGYQFHGGVSIGYTF